MPNEQNVNSLLILPLVFDFFQDDFVVLRTAFLQTMFSIMCGLVIRRHNEDILEKMKKLRDEAVAANESKLTFIAKMR